MNTPWEDIEIAQLIVRKLSGGLELTADEEQSLQKWILSNEEHQALYRQFSQEGLSCDFEQITKYSDQSLQWKRVENSLRNKQYKRILRWCPYAAVIVICLAVGMYYFSPIQSPQPHLPTTLIMPAIRQAVLILDNGQQIQLDKKDTLVNIASSDIKIKSGLVEYGVDDQYMEKDSIETYNTIVVPRGGIYSLILSDGSKVFLNSASELTYPVRFYGDVRKVTLKGEAFFEVSHHPAHPFIVKSGKVQTKVLGTVFNVMAYEDEPDIQTTLLEGSVEVTVENTSLREILKPGNQACWKLQAKMIEMRNVNIRLESLWKDGIIILDDDELESVMRMLCRWYDVTYVYDNPLTGTHTFTGRIDRNEDLESVLRTLTLLGGPKFRLEDNVIHILD